MSTAQGSTVKLKRFHTEGHDGLDLYAVSTADATAEAFANRDNQVYFGKGAITIQEGDVVLDCGANVGSFARMAAPVLGPRGTIYCIEPLPDVCTALEVNIQNYQKWAHKHNLRVAKVVAVQAGVGDARSLPQRQFTYYPRLTAMSSMYPDEADASQATFSLVLHRPQSFSLLEDVGKFCARMLLLRPAETVTCHMVTVSQLLQQYNIKEVGLLKINVERAESDVLAGVADKDWPKIRQVSAQVHDIDGRVKQLSQVLQQKGFQIEVYQEPRFVDCNLHMVYGFRPSN
eukprot:gene9243-9407_t